MYKAKKGDSFHVGLKCLEMMWMFKQDHKEEGAFVYIFRATMALVYITFLQIGPTLHIVMVASRYKSISVSDALADTVGGVGFTLVYFKVLAGRHRCSIIFKSLVDHEKFGKPKTFDAMGSRCRMLALFFLYYCPVSNN
nr:unnamed protein product [Callosobruchus chinensis]